MNTVVSDYSFRKSYALKMLAVIALLAPAYAGAGDKVYTEGTVVQGIMKAKDSTIGFGTATRVDTKNWIIVIKVGDYQYAGYVDRTGGIFASKGPKQDDWPVGSKVRVYFHHRMGSLYMDLKSSTGKEEDSNWVFSKIGPDGKELCGKFKCAKTAEDGDD